MKSSLDYFYLCSDGSYNKLYFDYGELLRSISVVTDAVKVGVFATFTAAIS